MINQSVKVFTENEGYSKMLLRCKYICDGIASIYNNDYWKTLKNNFENDFAIFSYIYSVLGFDVIESTEPTSGKIFDKLSPYDVILKLSYTRSIKDGSYHFLLYKREYDFLLNSGIYNEDYFKQYGGVEIIKGTVKDCDNKLAKINNKLMFKYDTNILTNYVRYVNVIMAFIYEHNYFDKKGINPDTFDNIRVLTKYVINSIYYITKDSFVIDLNTLKVFIDTMINIIAYISNMSVIELNNLSSEAKEFHEYYKNNLKTVKGYISKLSEYLKEYEKCNGNMEELSKHYLKTFLKKKDNMYKEIYCFVDYCINIVNSYKMSVVRNVIDRNVKVIVVKNENHILANSYMTSNMNEYINLYVYSDLKKIDEQAFRDILYNIVFNSMYMNFEFNSNLLGYILYMPFSLNQELLNQSYNIRHFNLYDLYRRYSYIPDAYTFEYSNSNITRNLETATRYVMLPSVKTLLNGVMKLKPIMVDKKRKNIIIGNLDNTVSIYLSDSKDNMFSFIGNKDSVIALDSISNVSFENDIITCKYLGMKNVNIMNVFGKDGNDVQNFDFS